MPLRSLNKKGLLIGPSRGLGFALAEEYLKRGWGVVATERRASPTRLHDLADACNERLEIENVDIVYQGEVTALRARLASRMFDRPFVNADVKNDARETIADVSTEVGSVRTEVAVDSWG